MSAGMLRSMSARLVCKVVQMCFIVLFGTMSVLHFPVMAFGGDPHGVHAHTASHAAAHSHYHGDDADQPLPARPARCDGFACFLAIEPAPFPDRQPGAVLFGILRFTPADLVLTAAARPDPPPPRLQG